LQKKRKASSGREAQTEVTGEGGREGGKEGGRDECGDTGVGSFLLVVHVAEEEEGVLGEGGPDGGD